MHSTPLLSGAALLGIFSGLVPAGITPTAPLPTKQPEWRGKAASLRAETESLYAWSMPEDLSPTVGYGNPAYHQAAVQVRYEPQRQARAASLPPYPPVEFVEEPPVRTGNEATIAEMEALNDSFEQGAAEPAPREGGDEEDQLFGG